MSLSLGKETKNQAGTVRYYETHVDGRRYEGMAQFVVCGIKPPTARGNLKPQIKLLKSWQSSVAAVQAFEKLDELGHQLDTSVQAAVQSGLVGIDTSARICSFVQRTRSTNIEDRDAAGKALAEPIVSMQLKFADDVQGWADMDQDKKAKQVLTRFYDGSVTPPRQMFLTPSTIHTVITSKSICTVLYSLDSVTSSSYGASARLTANSIVYITNKCSRDEALLLYAQSMTPVTTADSESD